MSTLYWKGSAPAVAGVKQWTFTTAGSIGDIITVTIGSKAYQYTTTSATIATFLPLLAAALNALDSTVYPEFAEITWGSTSSTLTATDDTAGKPSIVNVTTNSGSTTINSGTITAASNATPIVITSASHGLSTGTVVTVASVGGNTNANGTWIITRVSANTFSLDGSAGNSNYTAGGTWTAPTGNTTTLSSGPKSVRTPANYSSGTVPVAGDTLYIDLEGAELLYDLEFFSSAYGNAITLAVRCIIAKDVTIGLPVTNEDATAYTEYRQMYWKQGVTSDYINTDSDRVKLDYSTIQTTCEVDATGRGSNSIPALLICGTHASNAFTINSGEVGFAFFDSDTARVNVGRLERGCTVFCGIGCTNDTWNNYGGTLTVFSAIGTALNHPSTASATTTIEGSGAVAQLTAEGGTIYYNSTGALGGNTVLAGSAILSFDKDVRAKAITNAVTLFSASAKVKDTYKRVTAGYSLAYTHCAPPGFPAGVTLAVTYT